MPTCPRGSGGREPDDNLELSTVCPGLLAENALASFLKQGFALVRISPIIQAAMEEVYRSGNSFFHCAMTEKVVNKLPNDLGYRPLGIEYSQSPFRPDEVESFSVGPGVAASEVALLSESGKSLHERMLCLFAQLQILAEELTITLAERLTDEKHRERLLGGFERFSTLQLNSSQPSQAKTDHINDVHEDGSLVTILSVTGAGLEVQDLDGSFVPVVTAPNEVFIMSGEILWLLSGGQVPAVNHRVLPARYLDKRMSILFFGDLVPSLCRPWLSNETNRDVNIGERVRRNPTRFGLSAVNSD